MSAGSIPADHDYTHNYNGGIIMGWFSESEEEKKARLAREEELRAKKAAKKAALEEEKRRKKEAEEEEKRREAEKAENYRRLVESVLVTTADMDGKVIPVKIVSRIAFRYRDCDNVVDLMVEENGGYAGTLERVIYKVKQEAMSAGADIIVGLKIESQINGPGTYIGGSGGYNTPGYFFHVYGTAAKLKEKL